MKLFWTILKYFGITAGSITVLYGVFAYFDGLKDDVKDIKTDVEMISVEQTWMAEDISGIRDTLVEYEKEHKIQGQTIRSIEWGLLQHENYSPEQFEEVMTELLKKNYGPTVLNNPTLLNSGENDAENITGHTGVRSNSSQ